MVLEQRMHSLALRGRQKVEHGQAPVLIELIQQIGSIIGRHPGQQGRRFLIRSIFEKLLLVRRIELLEDVGRQFWIGLNGVDYFFALLVGRALHEVGNERGMEPLQASQRHQQAGGRYVPDEWLDVSPVQNRRRRSWPPASDAEELA